jgi:hypothetical protein
MRRAAAETAFPWESPKGEWRVRPPFSRGCTELTYFRFT